MNGSRRDTRRFTALTLLANAGFAFWFFLCFPAGVLWLGGSDLRPPPGASRWLGAALITAAQLGLIRPLRRFILEGRGTQAPLLPPSHLVVGGAHAFVRNPMYLLYLTTVLGEAVLYRSSALAVYALAFFALEHAYVIGVEEKRLRQRFGADYTAYCARVNRWLPLRRRG